jgi:predicted dehydrogenase
MLRAAVVGCGAIGAGTGAAHPDVGVGSHAAAYAACPDTELVAVCDTDLARARACADRWGAPAVHADAGELIAAAAPELVSVCTPDGTHAALVALALRAPATRAVLAEKPLAGDARTAAELAARARERGVVLAVNHTRRFPPAFRALRAALADGAIGELQHVAGGYVAGLRHNGTHWLDLLRMLAGEPTAVRGRDRLREGGPDPTLDAELALPGGASAQLAGLDARRFTHFEMDLVGTAGRVRIVESGHRIETLAPADDPRHPGHRALRLVDVATGALRDAALHAVADVARCVREGGEPACTGADATAALALAEAVAAGAAHGGREPYCAP